MRGDTRLHGKTQCGSTEAQDWQAEGCSESRFPAAVEGWRTDSKSSKFNKIVKGILDNLDIFLIKNIYLSLYREEYYSSYTPHIYSQPE